MGGSIIARVGVLGQQQAQEEGIPDREAGQVENRINREQRTATIKTVNGVACHLYGGCYPSSSRIELVRGKRRTDHTSDNQDHPDNVPADTDIIEEGDNAHTKYVEHGNHSQD